MKIKQLTKFMQTNFNTNKKLIQIKNKICQKINNHNNLNKKPTNPN